MSLEDQSDQNHSERCFHDWMNVQELDLAELLRALTLTDDDKPPDDQSLFAQLAEKNIEHFQEYVDKRNRLAHNDVSVYFAPTWNSALENSLLWLAGCRPSIFIRLVYALCGSQVESQIAEHLQGTRTGNLGDLSLQQLNMVNVLHCKTIKHEEKLTTQLASLQEDIADEPISMVAKEQSHAGDSNEVVDRALQNHDEAMVRLLQEADNLRLTTLKELISILTPVQAVDYLAAGRKLHLCMHEWGKKRDLKHGRGN
ncbi:protein DELAY OF GERMINATION 1 [Ricinus communis]|uniref:DOG1 domain-containing protein n=1 Tax=Ricinus communis TaxID=3988 RepID=B9THQ4_RICCO|nr:protein DELAY OF GERMINATION 1 [Ricinus communis]EEF24610.1 conserved hypothetical protein [Ricinus communis]|eukprot:XP_002537773.1 protein DELAY OF GERMINATION 1 [Ricinus communis]